MNRYLTKSRFKLALECPTKLYYTGKKTEYADGSLDDPFLRALARGGFQVGALAQAYFPEGLNVDTLSYDEVLKQTNELLKKENVVIFEAAIKFENLFVRVDVLEKKGNILNLYEVKAKSVDPSTFYDEIWDKRSLNAKKNKKYKSLSKWREYIYDVAFQTYVASKAFPKLTINPFLTAVDKTKITTVDGLNQKFLLKNMDGRTKVEIVGPLDPKALGDRILTPMDISDIVNVILSDKDENLTLDEKSFTECVKHYSKLYAEDKRANPIVGSQCKACQFRPEDNKLKSGFKECWQEAKKVSASDCDKKFVFDLWNYKQSDERISENIILLKDMTPDLISEGKESDIGGLSNSDRQKMQIDFERRGHKEEFIDLAAIRDQIKSWTYPLHFIDFETSMVAIPFNKGKRPYEQIAFQFSHHIMEKDGSIRHAGEYINAIPGAFPNFEFVAELKAQLEKDNGTIFRYSNHENTVLCQIHDQLSKSKEPNRDQLMKFIETITSKRAEDKKSFIWHGNRNMVDLCEIIKRFWFNPLTGGSNSIKYVLPAILGSSKYLQERYSKPIYGKEKEIHSSNFTEIVWVKKDSDGTFIDPYKQLPPVFSDYDRKTLSLLSDEDDDVRDGGAAMTAYSRMQFTQMSETEREKIRLALLKYCELDTLAMVMLVEHWKHHIETSNLKKEVA